MYHRPVRLTLLWTTNPIATYNDTCCCQLNTALAIWQRNHYHLALFHTGLWWRELNVWTYISFLEEMCFWMRIYTMEIPTNHWNQWKYYLEVEVARAGLFWQSGASNSPCMVILTNLRFLRILTESFHIVLCWIMIQRNETMIWYFFEGKVFSNMDLSLYCGITNRNLKISENAALRRNEQACLRFVKAKIWMKSKCVLTLFCR